MGVVSAAGGWQTLRVRLETDICVIRLDRPRDNNTINRQLIHELGEVLEICREQARIVVLEGSPEVFCLGADFNEIEREQSGARQDPGALYDLWLQLAQGPFISIAHVRGKVNAGGVGFVAACDVALSEEKASFSLSELLFGLMPACVLPFLIRRVGVARANSMTLTTRPIHARQAQEWGLIDACEPDSENLLRKQLLHFRRLSRPAVIRYKQYMSSLSGDISSCRDRAIRANREVFSDAGNLQSIARYVRTGRFPWEATDPRA